MAWLSTKQMHIFGREHKSPIEISCSRIHDCKLIYKAVYTHALLL